MGDPVQPQTPPSTPDRPAGVASTTTAAVVHSGGGALLLGLILTTILVKTGALGDAPSITTIATVQGGAQAAMQSIVSTAWTIFKQILARKGIVV